MSGMRTNDIADALGFTWDRGMVPDLPVHDPREVLFRYRKLLPQFAWDAAVIEGSSFTFPEVQTLLDGVTVGGRHLADEMHVLGMCDAARFIADEVADGEFDQAFTRNMSDRINSKVCCSPQVGYKMRAESVETRLRETWYDGTAAIKSLPRVAEQAFAYFLFAIRHRFYASGRNATTARFMMNGWLMAHGIDAINVPSSRLAEFSAVTTEFRQGRPGAGTGAVAFLASCFADMG